MRGIVVAVGALCAAVVFSGCASSKMKERVAVLDAENTDLRQSNEQLNGSLQAAQAESDRAVAALQAKESERAAIAAKAEQNAAAKAQLDRADQELAQMRAQNEMLNNKIAALSRPTPAPSSTFSTASPALAAFKNDLQAKLLQFHVTGVDVDIRTAQDGQQRVAVVLQNSFRAGSASLSYNTTAVKAVVGLGKLIADSYPGSRVNVEGHTDADKITRSKWESNEALSLARAEEVKKILRQAGVMEGRVTAVGMGARQLIARGTNDRAKAQNRRVEIYIYPATAN